MERDKYLKEIEKVLDDLIEDKALINKHFHDLEGELAIAAWRYKTEEIYADVLKWRKIKNSIDYLLLLRENKDK